MTTESTTRTKRSLWLFIALTCLLPQTVFAALPGRDSARQAADRAGMSTDQSVSLIQIIGGIIQTALGLLGVIIVVLLIYAGFLWMTAGGNDDQVTKAKKILRNSVIGLIIVFSAYAISTFILDRVLFQAGLS
jgi:hypothetical protein